MGYTTRYELHTTPVTEQERVRARIAAFDRGDPFEEECKWYDHEEHVRTVSAEIKDVIIRVDGQGEEADDVWVLYALNGSLVKHRRPKWDPPPPDAKWLATVASSEAQKNREAAAERDRELAELARLKAKYERQARPK
jgi:hypothetical protein